MTLLSQSIPPDSAMWYPTLLQIGRRTLDVRILLELIAETEEEPPSVFVHKVEVLRGANAFPNEVLIGAAENFCFDHRDEVEAEALARRNIREEIQRGAKCSRSRGEPVWKRAIA